MCTDLEVDSYLKTSRYLTLTSIFVILLLAGSSIGAQSTAAADVADQMETARERSNLYYDLESESIDIFYDEDVPLVNGTAYSLNQSLALLTPDVEMIEIDDFNSLTSNLGQSSIAIYVFNTTYSGMQITSQTTTSQTSWSSFAGHLSRYRSTDHVFAMGNTHQLMQRINTTNIHGSNQEVVDAEHMFVYTMWTLADLLESKSELSARDLGKNIRRATLQYFGNNVNDLITRNIQPQDTLGDVSPATRNESRNNFFEQHPASVKRIEYTDRSIGEENLMMETSESTTTTDSPTLDFVESGAITPSDFILQALPTESGLRGPIGGIVDALLQVLIDQFSSAIGISQDVVDQIADVLVTIPDLIGALSDPTSSKMKNFLENAKNLLPIPDDQSELFDFVVDGLFALRGDFNQIKDFLLSGAQFLIPDISVAGVNIMDLLGSLLDIGQEISSKVSAGDNVISAVFNVLNEKILLNYTKMFLGNISTYIPAVNLNTLISQVSGIISTVTNVLTTGNLTELIVDYGPLLFNALGVDQSIAEPIMEGLSLLLTASGYDTNLNLVDILTDLLLYFTPSAQIDTLLDIATSIVSLISDSLGGNISLADLDDELLTILESLPLGSEIVNAIEVLVALVLKARDTSLDLSQLDYTATLSTFVSYISSSIGGLVSEKVDIITSTAEIIINLIQQTLQTDLSMFVEAVTGQAVTSVQNQLYSLVDIIIQSQLGQTLQQASQTASDILNTSLEAIDIAFKTMNQFKENAIQGVMTTLLQGASFIMGQIDGFEIPAVVEVITGILGEVSGVINDPPSLSEIIDNVISYLPSSIVSEVETVINFIFDIKDMFTNTFQALFVKLGEWITGQVSNLIQSLSGPIGDALNQSNWQLLDISLPIGIGSFSLFSIAMKLGLEPGLEFDAESFTDMLFDVVFNGASLFNGDLNPGNVLREALSFLSIVPKLKAEFELNGFGSESQAFLQFLLETLGLELSFSGSGFFNLSILSFENGIFNTEKFMKVVEWGFDFIIEVSKTFTILDILTGGAGGGLSSLAQYIGLDAITLTIALTLGIDIIKRAATANRPETGSMTISIGIAATVAVSLDIIIATLLLSGTIALTLTLVQDLVEPTPMRVFIAIELVLKAVVDFEIWEWDAEFRWSPEGFAPPLGYELTPSSPQEAANEGALGGDFDGDGLGNVYESNLPGFDPNSDDTDSDGLSDKFESQTLHTDPMSVDTDNDGLSDKIEYDLKTNPNKADTDLDQLDDFEEVSIIGTDPLSTDSDQDGLSDYYEVNHQYNISTITPTVDSVTIGGKDYSDRTDPLNGDTDGDGLLDGAEGPTGVYYGPELANRTDGVPPLYFNNGYTSPLDADTDDDSYLQLANGSIANVEDPYLMEMGDYQEIHGIEVTFTDTETGIPKAPVLVRTNPVLPDSDSDTGESQADRDDPPIDLYLNSDGYELSRDPPTDPNDADFDDDGLIDGLEGVLKSDSNHTDSRNPDTDGDGLGDLQEVQLGSDPRSIDSDLDGVTDGDEYFIYGTSLFNPDQDGDGLLDGEELFTYHSSPFLRDSDKDGINDYNEVFIHNSDPSDKDSDNDFLNDYEEIFIHYTNPRLEDTDGDLILDGEEVQGLEYNTADGQITVYTDPLKWDTDGDSLTQLDENGDMTLPLSDYEEFQRGTRPDRMDSDQDGLRDSWEIWVGMDRIPHLDPIPLDPLSDDTDGDGLYDGQEFRVANVSTLLYPYVGFTAEFPLGSSPVLSDTDGDGLSDLQEKNLTSNLNSTDTDGDTLNDFAEFDVYNTSVTKSDTDGDGLSDSEEINGFDFPAATSSLQLNELVFSDPNESDDDGDLIPDGQEVYRYNTDPRLQDQDDNGIIDGLDIDSDGDGIPDGAEFYTYNTVESGYGGGPFDADSDDDALSDGQEILQIGTDPSAGDTDQDGFGDGLEYHCGSDPLQTTSKEEIDNCLVGSTSGLVLLSPANTTYHRSSIDVIAYTENDDIDSMEYRYKSSDATSYSLSVDMTDEDGDSQWLGDQPLDLPLQSQSYELEVVASTSTGTTITHSVQFTVNLDQIPIRLLSPGKYNYKFNSTPVLPVEVEAALEINQVNFDIVNSTSNDSVIADTLSYDSARQAYFDDAVALPAINGTTEYQIKITANTVNGATYTTSAIFNVTYIEPPENASLSPFLIGGIITGGVGLLAGGAILVRRRFFNR